MDLHKVGIKFLAEEGSTVELIEFIPVFHRWIQNGAFDLLLIDAADYSHVHAGPGIVLVAHEGNFSVDETGHRRGLVYYSKHQLPGDMTNRLATVSKHALTACRMLEEDGVIKGRLSFPGNEIQIFANDRLQAPNTDETWAALEPSVKDFLTKLYDGSEYSIEKEPDPKERFQITVKTEKPVPVATLLERVST